MCTIKQPTYTISAFLYQNNQKKNIPIRTTTKRTCTKKCVFEIQIKFEINVDKSWPVSGACDVIVEDSKSYDIISNQMLKPVVHTHTYR